MDNTGGGEPDIHDTIDVLKCLRCGQEGCTNVPGMGYIGEGPTLCSEHATPVMEQIVALRCEHADCNARRTFGFDGAVARACAAHKLDGMVDLMKRRSQVGEVARKHLPPHLNTDSVRCCCCRCCCTAHWEGHQSGFASSLGRTLSHCRRRSTDNTQNIQHASPAVSRERGSTTIQSPRSEWAYWSCTT